MTTGTKDTNVLRFVIWVILKLFWVYFCESFKIYVKRESYFFFLWEENSVCLGKYLNGGWPRKRDAKGAGCGQENSAWGMRMNRCLQEDEGGMKSERWQSHYSLMNCWVDFYFFFKWKKWSFSSWVVVWEAMSHEKVLNLSERDQRKPRTLTRK